MDPSYATVAVLRAEPDVPDGEPPLDGELANKLLEAEDLIDRIAGARGVDVATGRKFVPARMSAGAALALERATVILAVEVYRDPAAFAPAAAKTVSGPDFTLTDVAGLQPAGANALRRAAALLDVYRLRVLVAALA